MRAAAAGLSLLLAGAPAQAAPAVQEVGKLVAPVRLPQERFGAALAVDGEVGLVGAPEAAINGLTQAGRALTIARAGEAWAMGVELDPQKDLTLGRRLGHAAALRPGLLVAGAPSYFDGGYVGAAYAYALDGPEYKVDSLVEAPAPQTDLNVAHVVGMANDRLLVGTYLAAGVPGRAYAFVRVKKGEWSTPQTLSAADPAPDDRFGAALAARDERVVIGAPGVDDNRGAAYVFDWDNGAWVQTAKLVADERVVGDVFGAAVAVDGATVVVGAPGRDGASGTAYVFREADGAWMQVAALAPEVPEAGSLFASRLALRDPHAVITAHERARDPAAPSLGGRGRAYWFGRTSDDVWTLLAELEAGDGVAGDRLGYAVDLSAAGEALLGAPGDDESLGAVYVFRLAQAAGDGCVDHVDCAAGTCCQGVCSDAGTCESGSTSTTEGEGSTAAPVEVTSGSAATTAENSTGTGSGGASPPGLDLEPAEDSGCGCASGHDPGAGSWLLLLGWLLGRRTRRARRAAVEVSRGT